MIIIIIIIIITRFSHDFLVMVVHLRLSKRNPPPVSLPNILADSIKYHSFV